MYLCEDVAYKYAGQFQSRTAIPDFLGQNMIYDSKNGIAGIKTAWPLYPHMVMHHELYHYIDLKDDNLERNIEQGWVAFNPVGFSYGSGGSEFRTSNAGEWPKTVKSFTSLYATSGIEEDKAELFGHMIVNYWDIQAHIANGADPGLVGKMNYLKNQLRAFIPEMTDAWWNDRFAHKFPLADNNVNPLVLFLDLKT